LSHDHCKPVRYNRGMVRKEKRAVGTVWVFRWSEEVNGQLGIGRTQSSLRPRRESRPSRCFNGGSPKQQGLNSASDSCPRCRSSKLEQLPLREATMALVDAVTALRASELVALKWKHVGWETGILQSEFAMVEGELKETKSRNNPLPLAECVLQVLRLWRENTAYRSDEDWIFASPHYHGKTPYTYQILFRRHIRPVIEKISGIKSSKEAPIGWHTLRRSLATLLISNGENVKVAQSQLRHTTPKITLELYAQAVSADQQEAHKKVVQMVLPAEFSEKLKARSVTATA